MSCCPCIKIKLIDAGKYLDLAPDFSLEHFKSREELNNINQISTQAIVDFSIPATPKNKSLAADLLEYGAINASFRSVDCIVQENGQTLNFTKFQFISADDEAGTLTARIYQGEAHWIDKAAALQLPDISGLGNYNFTLSNVTDIQADNAEYSDGDDGIYFPLVYYGRFFRENLGEFNDIDLPLNLDEAFTSTRSSILVEDFRPWFHILWLLQKGFCHLGWDFRSSVLESSTGRRLGAYLLDKDFGANPDRLQAARFEASLSQGPQDEEVQEFSIVNFDNGNNYVSNKFVTPGIHDLHIKVLAYVSIGDAKVFIVKYDSDGKIVEVLFSQAAQNDIIQIDTLLRDVHLLPGEHIKAFQSYSGNYFVQVLESKFYNTPKRILPQRGETVTISEIIGNYNFLDFFKGVIHLFNGKLKTDWLNKTVHLYIPQAIEWYEENIEGFEDTTFDNWTAKAETGSGSIIYAGTDLKRFQKFAFQESTDFAIDNIGLADNVDLFQKVIDFGEEYEGGEDEYRNPFFEPTLNKDLQVLFENNIANPDAVIPPDIPHMLDNDNGRLGFNFKPRLLYLHGVAIQTNSTETRGAFIRLENATTQGIPYAYQVPGKAVYIDSELPTVRIAYGNYSIGDLYTFFWANQIQKSALLTNLQINVELTQKEVEEEDFRKPKRLFYNGRSFVANLLEIAGRRTCSTAPVPVVLQPEPHPGDYCAEGILQETCDNQVRINVALDFDAITIIATANNEAINSSIDSETWEVSTDAGITFTSYTPGNAITGEATAIFKRSVVFSDDCPTKSTTRTGDLSSLCDNKPGLDVVFNETEGGLVATRSGSFNSDIDEDDIFVSIDGAEEISYTESSLVSNFETVRFRRVVSFTNHCPDVEVITNFDLENLPCQNSPQIEFEEVFTGGYLLKIAGDFVSQVAYTDFQISYDDGANWVNWDRSPILPTGDFKARAIIHYQDNCPPVVITADCPEPE